MHSASTSCRPPPRSSSALQYESCSVERASRPRVRAPRQLLPSVREGSLAWPLLGCNSDCHPAEATQSIGHNGEAHGEGMGRWKGGRSEIRGRRDHGETLRAGQGARKGVFGGH